VDVSRLRAHVSPSPTLETPPANRHVLESVRGAIEPAAAISETAAPVSRLRRGRFAAAMAAMRRVCVGAQAGARGSDGRRDRAPIGDVRV
jgi:hypothetical protein